MTESQERRNFESVRFGPAQAVKARGSSTWRVSFAGGVKGRVEEEDGLFRAVYMAHGRGVEVDCELWPSLRDAVDALMDED